MQLTQFTDYALRVLMDLAMEPDRLKTIDELALRHRASRNHVAKIIQKLSKLGHVHTIRGKGGGIELTRPAQELVIGQLIRETESFALVECLGPKNRCRLTPNCELKTILQRATHAFLAELDNYTLADIVRHPEGLLGRLSN